MLMLGMSTGMGGSGGSGGAVKVSFGALGELSVCEADDTIVLGFSVGASASSNSSASFGVLGGLMGVSIV